MEEVHQLPPTNFFRLDPVDRFVEKLNALVLEDHPCILLTNVGEAGQHTSASIHRLDNVMGAKHHIVQNLAVFRDLFVRQEPRVHRLLQWAEGLTLDLDTLTEEERPEVSIVVIKPRVGRSCACAFIESSCKGFSVLLFLRLRKVVNAGIDVWTDQ